MMTKDKNIGDEATRLRKVAEEKLEGQPDEAEDLSPEAKDLLLHELRGRQIELEMQNDELRRIQAELEKTRDGDSDLYDFAPIGYLTVNQKGFIDKANLIIASMLGVDRSVLIGKPFTRFILRDDQDTFYKHRQHLLETETPQSCELRLVKNDGHAFYACLECMVVTNKGGDLKQIRVAVSDITSRKQAEEALRKSEERYRILVENSLNAIVIYEQENILFANEAFFKTFGYKREELQNILIDDILAAEVAETVAELRRRRMAGEIEKNAVYESMGRRKSGEIFDMEISVCLVPYQGDQSFMAFLTDISKRKHAENALRESERALNAILDATNESILLIDRKSIVHVGNKTVCDRMGITKEKLFGMSLYDFFPPEVAEGRRQKWDEVFNTGKPVFFEDSRGGMIFEQRAYPVFDDGNFVKMVAIFARDITKRRRAQEALQESEKKYRDFFNKAQVGMFRAEIRNGNVLECNDYFAQSLGYETRQACIDNCVISEHYAGPDTFEKMLDSLMEKGELYDQDICFSRKDVDDFWVRCFARSYPEKGYIEGAGFVITNERKALEELGNKAKSLVELNAALNVLLNKRDQDKEKFEEGVLSNVKTIIEPYLGKLKNSELTYDQRTLFDILESNLNEIISPFTRRLSSKYLSFTPKEIGIANLITQDKTNKEIAEIQGVTRQTIEGHREHIRKKLGLVNTKTNLATYLRTII